MKRAKRLYALLGVLVVVCAATFAVMQFEEKKEKIKNSGEIILELSSDTVQSLSWEYEDTSLSFHKDETWLYDGDEAFPVDEEKIHELLEPFESFGVSFIIEDVEDYGMYGLDDPVCTIQLETADQTYEITLGDFSNMDSERYVSIGDGNVYLAKNDPLDQFDAVLQDMIDHDETFSYDQVSRIEFTGAEAYSISYEEDSTDTYCADDVYFIRKGSQNLPLDSGRVKTYLKNLTQLKLTDYVTYNVTEEELQSYGLDTPELTITVDYTTEDEDGKEISDTFVVSISRDPEELAAAQEAEESEDDGEDDDDDEEEITAYARVGESQIIYKISEYDYNNLMAASYGDLRHREVLTADFDDVNQVDITLEDSQYSITAEGEEEDDRVRMYQEEELEIGDFQNALDGLCAEGTDSFTSEKPAGKKEISLTVYLNNENYPQVKIDLYRYDGSDCLAVVDGQPFALVNRSDVVDLIEAVNAIVLN